MKTSYDHGVIFTLLSHPNYLLIEMVHGKLKVKLYPGQEGNHEIIVWQDYHKKEWERLRMKKIDTDCERPPN